MFALYNNKRYDAQLFDGKCALITFDPKKTDEDFEIIDDGPEYAKTVELTDPKLVSSYNVKLSADYDAGIENTPKTWDLHMMWIDPDQRTVTLMYDDGALEGWHEVSGTHGKACTKVVSYDDLGQCYTNFTYYKKDGQVFEDEPMQVFMKIDADQLSQIKNYCMTSL